MSVLRRSFAIGSSPLAISSEMRERLQELLNTDLVVNLCVAYGHVDDNMATGTRSPALLLSFNTGEVEQRYTGPHFHRDDAARGDTYLITPDEFTLAARKAEWDAWAAAHPAEAQRLWADADPEVAAALVEMPADYVGVVPAPSAPTTRSGATPGLGPTVPAPP